MRAPSLEPPANSYSDVNNTEDTGVDDTELHSLSGRESSVEPGLQDAVSLSSDHGGKPADGDFARSVRSA